MGEIVDIMNMGTSVKADWGPPSNFAPTVPMKFPPTPEQQEIIDAFTSGDSLVIEALAGTGKTTTLKMLANAMPQRRGLYLAYNRVTADEARASFPSNVKCMTAHSLAYGVVGRDYSDRLNAKRVPPWELAKWLGVHQNFYISPDVSLVPMAVAGAVTSTIRNFCYSADPEPNASHVPWVKGAENYRPKVQKYILPLARKAWADLQKHRGFFPFSHDVYLKMYALTEPKLDYDYVMMDEAQDANALTLQLFTSQTHAQLVAVGDECQQLYGWRGSVNSMGSMQADHRLSLTKSFRFGPVVATEGQKWLTLLDSPLSLQGYEKLNTTLAPLADPDVVICRTNATVILEAMAAQARGQSFALTGGTADIEKFAKAAGDLKKGKRTLHTDLAAFEDWPSVQDYSRTPEGRDLATLVRLIDEHGVETLQSVAREAVPETVADITITTGHRAKGREWDKVRIAMDFEGLVTEEGEMTREGMMLAYVSVTRAQKVLDRSGLAFVDKLLEMNA